MRGETLTIVGLAAWVRPVPRKQTSALRLRIERRRQWLIEQERQRDVEKLRRDAEREERARAWFAEQQAARDAAAGLPSVLLPQAGALR